MKKNYVIDTSILLDDPRSIFGFDDNNVWITGTTLQELDDKKDNGSGEEKYNARECCRILDTMREKGDLRKGVENGVGGKLYIAAEGADDKYLPKGYSVKRPDNRIISTCRYLEEEICADYPKGFMNNDECRGDVILVTNDISMRVNASTCGIKVQKYLNDIVADSGYTGYVEIAEFQGLEKLYKEGRCGLPDTKLYDMNGNLVNGTGKPIENEYMALHYGNASALAVYRDGTVFRVKEQSLFGWVRPMNMYQIFQMHALMAPPEEIPLVIMSGPAGVAKTFMALAAGLDQTYTSFKRGRDGDGRYRKILVSRPNVESDEGFGYLPGDLQAKMDPLLAPYYDNLETLLRGKEKDEEDDAIQMQIEDLLEDGVIEICPLSHIRGRSISNAYIICDESQNAKRSLIRDVITRAGEGTKVVVLGDPAQIDAPTLDRWNNGLVYAAESMKGDKTTAILSGIPAKVSVRSKLAQTAIQRMQPSYYRG